ncbi:hypothetical protein AB0M43_09030 [Longispora sp. NPDC051575]|uniref:hypothetical protein n=1 Tax=Longispora sp. NPDC051575 TaxID=3154943 RepID=UPI003426C7D6
MPVDPTAGAGAVAGQTGMPAAPRIRRAPRNDPGTVERADTVRGPRRHAIVGAPDRGAATSGVR